MVTIFSLTTSSSSTGRDSCLTVALDTLPRPGQSGELEVRYDIETMIGGQAQKESIMGGIIILLTPSHLSLCHKLEGFG